MFYRVNPSLWRVVWFDNRHLGDLFDRPLIEFGLILWTEIQTRRARMEDGPKKRDLQRMLRADPVGRTREETRLLKEREHASADQWAAMARSRRDE